MMMKKIWTIKEVPNIRDANGRFDFKTAEWMSGIVRVYDSELKAKAFVAACYGCLPDDDAIARVEDEVCYGIQEKDSKPDYLYIIDEFIVE